MVAVVRWSNPALRKIAEDKARVTRGQRRRRVGLVARGFGLFILVGCLALPQLAHAGGTVNVLYAGSLVNLMERSVGPAFDKASGDHFRGYAGGSKLLANQIKGKLRRADVFISASPKANDILMGAANGNWVAWYVTFAQSPVVIGYNPSSHYAADFKSKPWYKVLSEPGIRIGRTDPKLDPKGALTVALMKRAEAFYKSPGLARRVLGAPENPAQVLPEEALVGRLQSGQLDAGFFYSTETSDAKIPTVAIPAALGAKAVYTVTIVHNAPDPAAAERFVAFLLGAEGQRLLTAHGLTVQKPTLSGAASAVPASLEAVITKR